MKTTNGFCKALAVPAAAAAATLGYTVWLVLAAGNEDDDVAALGFHKIVSYRQIMTTAL